MNIVLVSTSEHAYSIIHVRLYVIIWLLYRTDLRLPNYWSISDFLKVLLNNIVYHHLEHCTFFSQMKLNVLLHVLSFQYQSFRGTFILWNSRQSSVFLLSLGSPSPQSLKSRGFPVMGHTHLFSDKESVPPVQ